MELMTSVPTAGHSVPRCRRATARRCRTIGLLAALLVTGAALDRSAHARTAPPERDADAPRCRLEAWLGRARTRRVDLSHLLHHRGSDDRRLVIRALRGVTPKSTQIAGELAAGRIELEVLSDSDYDKALGADERPPLDGNAHAAAFSRPDGRIYLRRALMSDPDQLAIGLGHVVREGTLLLDLAKLRAGHAKRLGKGLLDTHRTLQQARFLRRLGVPTAGARELSRSLEADPGRAMSFIPSADGAEALAVDRAGSAAFAKVARLRDAIDAMEQALDRVDQDVDAIQQLREYADLVSAVKQRGLIDALLRDRQLTIIGSSLAPRDAVAHMLRTNATILPVSPSALQEMSGAVDYLLSEARPRVAPEGAGGDHWVDGAGNDWRGLWAAP